jgi:peptidoglycan/LPS O-acetylase OafA/YrhL
VLEETPWLGALVAVAGFPLAVNSCHQTGDAFDRHLGNLAYPLYLSHDLVDVSFEQWLLGKGLIFRATVLPLEWLLMTAAALAIYMWVDRPSERMRQRFVRNRRAPVVVPQKVIGGAATEPS